MIFGTAYLYEKMSQFIEQNKYVLLLIYEMLTLISSIIKSCKRSHNVRGFMIRYPMLRFFTLPAFIARWHIVDNRR